MCSPSRRIVLYNADKCIKYTRCPYVAAIYPQGLKKQLVFPCEILSMNIAAARIELMKAPEPTRGALLIAKQSGKFW